LKMKIEVRVTDIQKERQLLKMTQENFLFSLAIEHLLFCKKGRKF